MQEPRDCMRMMEVLMVLVNGCMCGCLCGCDRSCKRKVRKRDSLFPLSHMQVDENNFISHKVSTKNPMLRFHS